MSANRGMPARSLLVLVVEALGDNCTKNAHAVFVCVKVTRPVDSRMLVACDLSDSQPGAGDADVYQGLHFEPVTQEFHTAADGSSGVGIEAEYRNVLTPEGIEAVAEIRVTRAAEHVDQPDERPVAETA